MKPYYRVYSNESNAAEQVETLADAKARAEELAAKHPGRAFEILKCVGVSQTSQANTFWMDGEELPEEGITEARYRMLEIGEIIEDGDEFDCVGDGNWQPFILLVGSKLATIGQPARRPL